VKERKLRRTRGIDEIEQKAPTSIQDDVNIAENLRKTRSTSISGSSVSSHGSIGMVTRNFFSFKKALDIINRYTFIYTPVVHVQDAVSAIARIRRRSITNS
jgi:hypothetical protein